MPLSNLTHLFILACNVRVATFNYFGSKIHLTRSSKNSLAKLPARQSGLVLILALLIVVLVTSLVVSTSWRFELGMSRNENRWHGAQGRLVLEGGEAVAGMLFLTSDIKETDSDGDADHLHEDWSQPLQQLVDGGMIEARITDAQGRFNINMLSLAEQSVQQQPQQPQQPQNPHCQNQANKLDFECYFTVAQRRFIRLLQAIPLNERPLETQEAIEITEAVIDWMDEDPGVRQRGGAEQSYYNGLEVPIVVPNAPMTSISELSLVKGVMERPELYERLLPLVIALPAGHDAGSAGVAHLNINTMDALLFSIFNEEKEQRPLDPDQINELINIRNESLNREEKRGLQSVQDFFDEAFQGPLVNINRQNFNTEQLDTKTQYFIYSANVTIGDKTRRGKSLLHRKPSGGAVTTVWRTDANF